MAELMAAAAAARPTAAGTAELTTAHPTAAGSDDG